MHKLDDRYLEGTSLVAAAHISISFAVQHLTFVLDILSLVEMVKTKAGLLKRAGEHAMGIPTKLPLTAFSEIYESDAEATSDQKPSPDMFIRMPCSQEEHHGIFERVRPVACRLDDGPS